MFGRGLPNWASAEAPPQESEEPFHEDLFDNWRRTLEPRRSLGSEWTGRTECEAADGNWFPYVHKEPRLELFVPPDEHTWTGRRHTVVKYTSEFPFGETAAGPVSGLAPKPQPAPSHKQNGLYFFALVAQQQFPSAVQTCAGLHR